ncbi:MAG TPA: hypothetical protein IAB84_07030 [Candidatus Choladousia intestinigallinarum]|nr:hypothetical protein [Candidatus Choladousia intestinigallinarum]
MSQAYIWGAIVGAAFGIALLVALLWVTKSDGSLKGRYDERQELFRGRGYKAGFFTFIGYCILYAVLHDIAEVRVISATAAMFAGICLSVSVYACYCIRHDSYLALNEKPVRIIVTFFLVSLLNLGIGVYHFVQGNMVEDGVVSITAMNPICGLMMVVVAFAMLFRYRSERRHLEEEE